MAQHGGYRKPENPAAVSGPGKFSQRTDGGPGTTMTQAARYISGQPYGEAGPLNAAAQAAPLAAAPTQEVVPVSVTPLHAPTEYPNEPVTAGVGFGEGPGSEALPRVGTLRDEQPDTVAAVIRAAYSVFPSPHLRALVEQLDQAGRN